MLEVEGDPTLEGEMVHHWGMGGPNIGVSRGPMLEVEGDPTLEGERVHHWGVGGPNIGE